MAEIVQIQDKRRTFVDTLDKLAETDKNIVVIIPDVGFNYLSSKHNFPIVNTGVTEAFATIFAATLALDGWRPYLYSMINFVLFRPAEMVRNGIVCHKAPVTLIGVKGSTSYKFLGFSHNLLHDKEDFNFCDNISLKWHNPQNNEEVATAVVESYQSNEPRYIRL